ncbi:MAG: outer membrane lipoprotein-sorting protein [Pseudomonadota bacterium]
MTGSKPHASSLLALALRLLEFPKSVVFVAVVVLLVFASGLTRLVKDTSVDAFVPPNHPALEANSRTEELFGLADPIAVAVFPKSGSDVFTTEALTVLRALSDALKELPNIRDDRVLSLATEASIAGHDGAIDVQDYLNADPLSDVDLKSLKQRWQAMPPHRATLVSDDGGAAVVMAELVDPFRAAETYEAVLALAADAESDSVEVLVAGPAAVSGFLSAYIDADARVLQPLVFLVVLAFLFLAFLRGSALVGPLLILLGSAGGALGLMAWQGVPYFAITNALPVILVAISVADAIHIQSAYFEHRARFSKSTVRQSVDASLVAMVRPITLTTLTTIAGFVGIALTSVMPPISYFAAYAALGVLLAWAYSLFVLPSVLLLLAPAPSPLFASWRANRPDPVGRVLARVSLIACRNPVQTLSVAAVLMGFAALCALDVRADRSQVDNFGVDEPIRIADERIHQRFAGTAFLDVIVSSNGGTLLDGDRMQRVAQLQSFLDELPHVGKTVSIVDYLSALHAAVEERTPMSRRELPQGDGAIDQYLMVYEASGDPTDLDEELTPDYKHALIRIILDSHYYSDSKPAVESLQAYIDERLSDGDLRVTIAGDVNVAYHWMTSLVESHIAGVGVALCLILLAGVMVFRSAASGALAVLPVSLTVLSVYGVMGALEIHLEPATSMFAAIAVGVGVDFSIHYIDRIRTARNGGAQSVVAAVAEAAPGTARACFFNAAALGVGFAVLLISDLPTLERFGGLITLASVVSFLAALVLVPAGYSLFTRFRRQWPTLIAPVQLSSWIVVALGLWVLTPQSNADSGLALAMDLASRPEAKTVSKRISMELTNRRGVTRKRDAMVFRVNDAERRQTRITYLRPRAVAELSFLSWDAITSQRKDQRWLYLPAARKVRRIPASDRGDFFLGTDFSYEDIQSDFKFDVEEYRFLDVEQSSYADLPALVLDGTPISDQLTRELGHGGFRATIDPITMFPRIIKFRTAQGEPLKTIHVEALEQRSGIWTAMRVVAEHHISGHKTLFQYSDVQLNAAIPKQLFEANQLSRGLPKL